MTSRVFRNGLFLPLLILVAAKGISQAPPAQPSEARLRAHVHTLASAEYQGRRGAGGEKAASYLVEHFRKLGLEPLFEGSFLQEIPAREGTRPMGRNVGAILRGCDPALRDEWIVVSAHFDHLGRSGENYFPGADDNASGVAMMLEVARTFASSDVLPRRSLMFIGFDLEEVGLFGSRYFVEHSPVPLSRIALFITADMIGRSLGGVCDSYVFVMGTENTPVTRDWLSTSAEGKPLKVGLLGSDLLLLDRSDYGPFRSRKVPYLFFSTGENPCYHTIKDVPETIDYRKLEAISRVIHETARTGSESKLRPAWSPVPDNPLAEAKTMHDVLKQLLAHREELRISSLQLTLMSNTVKTLDGILARGAITPDERTAVVRVVRIILFSLF